MSKLSQRFEEYHNIPNAYDAVKIVARLLHSSLKGMHKDAIPYRVKLIERYSELQMFVGWKFLPGNRFRLEDGHFSDINKKQDVSNNISAVLKFSRYLTDQGIGFLYVQAPGKITSSDVIYGQKDYSNENVDDFLKGLQEGDVNYFDLRQSIDKQKINVKDLFYKTDHHWTQKAALWAANEIAEYLNQSHGFDIDKKFFDINNYEEEYFGHSFLGSHGRAITLTYCEKDEISILHPLFTTKLHLSIPSHGIDNTGSFDVMYDRSFLRRSNDPYTYHTYSVYLHGNFSIMQIENMLNSAKVKVLVIKDSFANPVNQFLALAFKNLDIIHLDIYSDSVFSFVKDNKPDFVIMMYYPGNITKKNFFNLW